MRFNLPRQVINQEIKRIISQERCGNRKCLLYALHEKKPERARGDCGNDRKTGPSGTPGPQKLPHDLGHGIFLHPDAAPILKDQVIGPYAGELSIVPNINLMIAGMFLLLWKIFVSRGRAISI